jgi:NitT/TauT family transport system permease protein
MSTQDTTVRLGGYPPARLGKRAGSILLLLAVWWGLTVVGFPTLPTPTAVATRFAELLGTRTFWSAALASTTRVYVAFVAAVLVAVPLGLLIGWSRPFADLTYPSFELIRPIPPIAWLPATILVMPVLTVAVGGGSLRVKTSVLFITFLGAFFPVLLNTIDGMRGVETDYSRAAESLGADPRHVFRHVYLPASLPAIHTGMVVGMGLAWVNLVAAEMIAGGGLGYITWSAYTAGSYPTIIVGMIAIGALGYGSSALLRALGDWLLGWQST